MTKKIVIIFIILAALVLSVCAFVWFKDGAQKPASTEQPISATNTDVVKPENTATTTSNLKTYSNEEWGFEFQFPEEWSFYENTFYNVFSKFNLIGATPKEGNNPNPIRPSILINIVTEDFAKKAAINRENIGAKMSKISVSGVDAMRYEYKEEISKISIDIPWGQYNFILSSPKEYESTLNQIISSFKFLKK